MTVRIAMHGASGRMGRAILRAIRESDDLELAGAIDREGSESLGQDAGELAQSGNAGIAVSADLNALERAQVAIDFSSPAATAILARHAAGRGLALVVGTTGLDAAAQSALDELAKRAAVVVAPNTSVGVNVLFHLAAEAARLLGPSFDAEIVELHHRRKVDAPSGTALRLAERVAEAKGLDASAFVTGRGGQVGPRKPSEIGVLAVRGGDIIGDHTLFLVSDSERIELTHRAQDRSLFAAGAVRAARWVSTAKPGRYDMADVLGLRRS